VAVSATSRDDTLAYFSARGSQVEISAPGDDVTSTIPGQSEGSMSGTSMAAPHIAGAAGLVLSVAPWMDRDALLYVLTSNADDLGAPGWDSSFGAGRLNLYQAVKFAADLTMLRPDRFTIDPLTGGSIEFFLDAGAAFAHRPYILLASLSWLIPLLLRRPAPECTAINIEVTVRNGNLGLLIKASMFPAVVGVADPVGDMVLLTILMYGGFALPLGLLQIWLHGRINKRRRAVS